MKKKKGWCMVLAVVSLATLIGLGGCNPKTPQVKLNLSMQYTEEEKILLDQYQQKQKGVKFQAFKGSSAEASIAGNVSDIGDLTLLPEDMFGIRGKIKYEGFIAFSQSGPQDLKLNGAGGSITISYSELTHKTYEPKMEFQAHVYYGITVEISLFNVEKNSNITLESKSEYKISRNRPTFQGVEPSSKIVPLMDEHLRDTFILAGPDGNYYMTGTYLVENNDWNKTNEIHIYKSPDLKEWTDLGAVWNIEKDGTWQKEIYLDGNAPIWAPEIAYINGTYYIVYSLGWGSMTSAILKSTSGRIEGPYADISQGPMFNYIDGSLFKDDDGRIYCVYSDGKLIELDKEMKPKGEILYLAGESGCAVGFEGCYIFKHNGMYVLTSATYNIHLNEDGTEYQTYDSMYAVSDKLCGPYSERRLLMEYGGHNNLFKAKDGKIYTTCFYSATFSERPGIVEIIIGQDGIITAP